MYQISEASYQLSPQFDGNISGLKQMAKTALGMFIHDRQGLYKCTSGNLYDGNISTEWNPFSFQGCSKTSPNSKKKLSQSFESGNSSGTKLYALFLRAFALQYLLCTLFWENSIEQTLRGSFSHFFPVKNSLFWPRNTCTLQNSVTHCFLRKKSITDSWGLLCSFFKLYLREKKFLTDCESPYPHISPPFF